ncbi:hypothetical protein TREMEDRAFT_69630 [Tremella mesenterica DSM 1558]|uniref:uncharacterized protein n=1 Tax=Tremella mesenterica (strain ATCC 24925 / CBS 8224 / DSM 1558 / NBRC 9311 / NRRL Y-6157 / RJB 2259-6 / UBC 559-6) TaxID=578456 RepID=UPI0003F499CD|nr:uncharacterized protein TREMEDRAFT_69630 [Tremella mesenterica DSM 1558]EIW67560.1 hypothetical protein TREMEDRAFT_69630 [Tremella mesenterica DSM 1558]
MRNRLERVNAIPEQGTTRGKSKLRDAIPSVDELSSAVSRINVAPWEDPFALALGQAAVIAEEDAGGLNVPPNDGPARAPSPKPDELLEDGYVEVEEDKNDKMRRIAKSLQSGDVVEEAHNIVRIVGVDACPGLLILGKRNLYLIDGLLQTPDGEVIDASDAPKDVLSIPSGTLVELDVADQQSLRWSYSDIVENNKRAFLFRDVALELYFADKRNFLVVFKNKAQRQKVCQKISAKNDGRDAISRSVIGNFVLDTVARAMERSEQQLEAMTKKWQQREISNFAYLQLLNQYANRTPNDVTQYPVFPWVLADYTSSILDLDKESTFRDLSLPMGALTPARREAAVERYAATEGVGEKPFHYGTHYSSSMIVCGFMIRLSPFTEIFLALQGGQFDLADRLFSNIARSWDSASSDNRGDVRELIPEFFYSSSFLININHHDFGKTQTAGETVDDVALPPWALGDPLLFTHRHREALESDHVSRHLPQWIDLIFGYKQRDPTAFNCFHPLSYRGAVDLEAMEDEGEKATSTAIIHNFGQTPAQIFKFPHSHKFLSSGSTLPLGTTFGAAEHWQLLLRSIVPVTETTTAIDDIIEHRGDAKPGVLQKGRLAIPGHHLSIHYGYTDGSLRIYYQEGPTHRLVHLIEGISVKHAVFATPTLLITASSTSVFTAWRVSIKGLAYKKGDASLHREATLRGHTREVTCLAASTGWSLLVSGSKDGTAMVWDTNRLRYTRTLQTPRSESIVFVSIHEPDGTIALASRKHIYLFSLNGHPIATTSIHSKPTSDMSNPDEEYTGGIGFLNREFVKEGMIFAIGVGRQVAIYRCIPGRGEGERPWRVEEQGRVYGSDDHHFGNCSMVRFVGETLYAGFRPGQNGKHAMYQWSLPEGNARHVGDNVSSICMQSGCGRHFGLLEPRRHCGGCGGLFCGTHAVHVELLTLRYCPSCRDRLSLVNVLGIFGRKEIPGQRSRSIIAVCSKDQILAIASRDRTKAQGMSWRPEVHISEGGKES